MVHISMPSGHGTWVHYDMCWCIHLPFAFAKHLAIHHPNEENYIMHFKFTLLETHKQPLMRQTSESCFIHNAKVDIQMNSKAEWHQPTVGRVVITRDLPELEQHADGRAVRRRGGQ